jgi:hypothetical protein
MAPSPPSTNNAPAAAAGGRRLLPPEEQFWKRYSPHYEFPLSSVSSFAIHAIVLILLVVGGMLAALLGLGGKNEALPVDAVAWAGGGGNPKGSGPGSGEGEPTPKPEDLGNPDQSPDNTTIPRQPDIPLDKLPKPDVQASDFPELRDSKDGQEILERAPQALAGLSKIRKDARDQLVKGLEQPPAGKGQGGKGKDGGKGTGTGTGQGAGEGAGKGKLSQRQKRVLRWTMMFDTMSGQDYLQQLGALGAILGYPDPNSSGQYRIIRKLRRGEHGEIEDLTGIKRIFWVDDKPDSVGALAGALGLPSPPHFVAFFPETLEKELLDKELRYRNRPEDQIQETRFRVRRDPRTGRYEPFVVDQR